MMKLSGYSCNGLRKSTRECDGNKKKLKNIIKV